MNAGRTYCWRPRQKPEIMQMSNPIETRNWPELAAGLYDKLTGRDAEISYQFENFELSIPSSTSSDAEHALWKMNGTIRITTRNASE